MKIRATFTPAPRRYSLAPCDMIVVDDDGRWGVLKAGTPLSSFDVAVETELDAEVVS